MERLKKSFRYAFRGIFYVLKHERNIKVEFWAMFFVVMSGLILGGKPWQWAILVSCFGVVIPLELMNSAIEKLCDGVTKEYNKEIGLAKDAAAGSVLFASIIALVLLVIVLSSDGMYIRLGWSMVHEWYLWVLNFGISLTGMGLAVKMHKKDKSPSDEDALPEEKERRAEFEKAATKEEK
ncbi:MAG TPA: diacylglycerol kinase family protein, partial [Clostridiales bacterium]|nr:diacylglycerol kinase family protein [Clostridiales bacterium]